MYSRFVQEGRQVKGTCCAAVRELRHGSESQLVTARHQALMKNLACIKSKLWCMQGRSLCTRASSGS